jgi:hypothetical protein
MSERTKPELSQPELTAQVTQLTVTSRVDEGSEATITVHRLRIFGSARTSPDVRDLPDDIRTALLAWLGVPDPKTELEKFKREAARTYAEDKLRCLECELQLVNPVHHVSSLKSYHPFIGKV